ncbi:related to Pseudomonas L-fucose dehydrogenase [Phialocephala subalpina]|uniref:Related to Pseudomonas L-fucose dehydrogenase n=1 Tax=Phialocephala subalpina TaxID=576137 RepID=A0A1L7WE75_9HELO|nr:related to Pseudomonas L-fucose dehydrogenase [Phialocephala subalpina]
MPDISGSECAERPPLSSVVSRIVLGGGSFSPQSHLYPDALPVRAIVLKALDSGIRTFDTSPYYGPSEILLADAFSQSAVTSKYSRQDYILMTKAGRISSSKFDYSPKWIHHSVNRSMERFGTSYFDVIFCHDVEYVTDEAAVTAVGVLMDLVKEGKIRYIGVSGYCLEKLIRVAKLVRARYQRPLDAVQIWAQLTLQNTRLESEGYCQLKATGVDQISSSSPLGIGLLRSGGVPIGALGDWHPAPEKLRQAALKASEYVETRGDDLASLALRFSISRLVKLTNGFSGASTILSASSVWELESNLQAVRAILLPDLDRSAYVYDDLRDLSTVNDAQLDKDGPLYAHVRSILGVWVDYKLPVPEKEWVCAATEA